MKIWLILLLFAVIAGADCGNSSRTAHFSPEMDRGTARGDQLSHRREELSPTSNMKAQETGPSKEEKQQAKKGKPQHLKEDDDPPHPKERDYETDAVYVLTVAVTVLVVCIVVVLIIRCRLRHGNRYPGSGFTEAMDDFERRHSSPEDLYRSRHHRQRVAGSERLATIPAEGHHRQGSRDHPYHLRQEGNDGPPAWRRFFPSSVTSPGYERVWTSSQFAQTHGLGSDDYSMEIEFSQRGGEEDRRARQMLARLCERFDGGLEERALIIDALINEYCVQRAEYLSAVGRDPASPVSQQYDVYESDLGQYVHTVSRDVPADAFEDHHHPRPPLAADLFEEQQDDHWWIQQQPPPPEYERPDAGPLDYTVVRGSPPPRYSWTLCDDHLESGHGENPRQLPPRP